MPWTNLIAIYLICATVIAVVWIREHYRNRR